MEDTLVAKNSAPAPDASAATLIQEIINSRIRDVRRVGSDVVGKLFEDESKDDKDRLLLEQREWHILVNAIGAALRFVEEQHRTFNIKEAGELIDAAPLRLRPATENTRLAILTDKLQTTTLMYWLLDTVIKTLIRFKPSLTRDEFLVFVKQGWHAARGRKAKSKTLFDQRLVRAAHEALLREHRSEGWGCRAACETLAQVLGTTTRTIQAHLARSRRKN